MQVESPTIEPPALRQRSKTQRSAVSNGTKLLMADGRSPWSRRFRDIVVGHCQDLGGYEALSQAEIAIVKRAATLQVELEVQEAALANGEAPKGFSLAEFAQIANGMRRLLETVGIKRVPKDCSLSLAEILREHAQNADEPDNAPATITPADEINGASGPPTPAQEAAE